MRLHSTWLDDTAPGESFHLFSAVKNRFAIGQDERMVEVLPGETVLIPACFGKYSVTPLDEGEATVIKTTL